MEERMEEFIKNNYSVLKLRATYTGMDSEEIFQTARCAYCFNEDIDRMVLAGDLRKASNKLCREFYKLIKHENSFGMSIGNNNDLIRVIDRLTNETETETADIETEMAKIDMKAIMLQKVKNLLDEERYTFLLRYYEMGSANVAELYGIAQNSAKHRAKRIVDSVKKRL